MDKSSLVYFRRSWSNPGGLGPDLDEPKLLLSGLGIALRSCLIVDSDQGTARIDKGIGAWGVKSEKMLLASSHLGARPHHVLHSE